MQTFSSRFTRPLGCLAVVAGTLAFAPAACIAATPQAGTVPTPQEAETATISPHIPLAAFYYYPPPVQPSWYHGPAAPAAPATPFPMSTPWTVATPSHPYPPGHVQGAYTSLSFVNYNPLADPAKGAIDVFLPATGATVYLNGQEMLGSGKVRVFTTPVLPMNREYQYFVTATYAENGHFVTKYRRVDVGAGEYGVADFLRPALDDPIKLPAGLVDENQVARGLSRRIY